MSGAPVTAGFSRPAPFLLAPDAAEALTGGRWVGPRTAVELRGAVTDSRRITAGCLFACFAGEKADGHAYAPAAAAAGAGLILATREVAVPVPVLLVSDATLALQQLAAEFRRRYRGATWIGITGSNGKTTTKELIASACAACGPAWSTQGNLNNHLGVPLTILATPAGRRFVVIEMGASAPGEIATLAAIAQVEVGVICSIGPAHLEGFGGLDGVARGKSELFRALSANGRAVCSRFGLGEVCPAHGLREEDLLAILRSAAGSRTLTVVGDPGCPLDGEVGDQGLMLRTVVGEVAIPLIGGHNLANAAVAWHAAVAAGCDARAALGGLAAVRAVAGRLQVRRLGPHRLLDDSYNANPASMAAGLAVLARAAGARLAVLGHMGELGSGSDDLHRRVGSEAARLGLPLLTVGGRARLIGEGYRAAGGRDLRHADDAPAAVAEVLSRLAVGPATILVKASRSAGLERVVHGIEDALGYGSDGLPSAEAPC